LKNTLNNTPETIRTVEQSEADEGSDCQDRTYDLGTNGRFGIEVYLPSGEARRNGEERLASREKAQLIVAEAAEI
jgi:hypothetical protein